MADYVVKNPKNQKDVVGATSDDRLTIVFTKDGDVLNTYSDGNGIVFGPEGASDDFRFSGIENITFDHTKGLGNDFVATGAGQDVISTGAGDDTIRSGSGIDQIDGGDGIDIWSADLSAFSTGVTIDLAKGTSKFLTTGFVKGVEGFDKFHGTQGADVLKGTALAASTIYAEGGDDKITVYGTAGFSSVDGGDGSDRLIVFYETKRDVSTEIYGTGNGSFKTGDDLDDVVVFSRIEHFSITTGTGNDRLVTGSGDDAITSGGGRDTILSGAGVDTIDGGDGVDLWGADLRGQSTGVTIDLNQAVSTYLGSGSVKGVEGFLDFHGTQGADVLTGTNKTGSLVYGEGGDDTITVWGGAGYSSVNGGDGSDRLVVSYDTTGAVTMQLNQISSGYYGVITGQDPTTKDDVAFEGIENFTITTGSGKDSIVTGFGDDVLSTGAGNDTIYSGAGADRIDGGDGIDLWGADLRALSTGVKIDLNKSVATYLGTGSVTGVEGFWDFHGTQGADVLTGTKKAGSLVYGEGGDDTISVWGGAGYSSVNGGEGSDRLVVAYNTSDDVTMQITQISSGYYGVITGEDTTTKDDVAFEGIEHFTITTGAGNDSIVTGFGDDVLSTGAGNDTIYSGAGVDKIDGGDGIDRWGADLRALSDGVKIDLSQKVSKFLGSGFVKKVEGFQDFHGTQGSDVLIGTKKAGSLVYGEGGDDTISVWGGVGYSSVNGGEGSDRLVVTYDTADDVTVQLNANSGGYWGTFSGEDASQVDDVAFESIQSFTITTGSGNDFLSTGFSNDSLDRVSNDKISSGSGNDTIYTGVGHDTIDGGKGADVWGGNLSNLDHGVEIDLHDKVSEFGDGSSVKNVEGFYYLTGTNYADTIVGTEFAGSTIAGANGDDDITVYMVGGNNSIDGGDGSDRLTIILDGQVTQEGGSQGNGYYGTFTDGTHTTSYYAMQDFTLVYEGEDSLNLYGLNGNDGLISGSGDDTLSGQGGADTISAGAGADLIIGGQGADRLTGGSGADTFVFANGDALAAADGYDTITDFKTGEDRIDLASITAQLPAGSYAEATFASDDFAALMGKAGQMMSSGGLQAVFIAGKKDGWLFFNTDGDPTTAEGAIRLVGLHSLDDFRLEDLF